MRPSGGFWTSHNGTELTLSSEPTIGAASGQPRFYHKHSIRVVESFVVSDSYYTKYLRPANAGQRLNCLVLLNEIQAQFSLQLGERLVYHDEQ